MLARVAATAPFTSHRQNAQVGGAEVQRFFVEGVARYLAHKVNRGGRKVAEETLAAERRLLRRGRAEWVEAAAYESVVRGAAAVDSRSTRPCKRRSAAISSSA